MSLNNLLNNYTMRIDQYITIPKIKLLKNNKAAVKHNYYENQILN